MVTKGDDVLAAITIEAIKYPLRTILFIHNMGGKNMRSWIKQAFDFCKELGKELGIDYIETAVRPSIARMIEKYGAEQQRIIMGMEIKL